MEETFGWVHCSPTCNNDREAVACRTQANGSSCEAYMCLGFVLSVNFWFTVCVVCVCFQFSVWIFFWPTEGWMGPHLAGSGPSHSRWLVLQEVPRRDGYGTLCNQWHAFEKRYSTSLMFRSLQYLNIPAAGNRGNKGRWRKPTKPLQRLVSWFVRWL